MAKAAKITTETLHNDPDAQRAALAERIAAQALRLRDEETSKREQWAAIGADLLMAREGLLSKNDFGAWVKDVGIDKLPGLTSASERSDVIWMAEFPAKVAKIDESISSPRYIRSKWRALFAGSCATEADALIALEATDVPDIEAAADGVAVSTGCDQAEAFAEIKRLVEAEQDDGETMEASAMKAIPALKKALQKAADAGVTHEMLCANAGAVWGGFFSWDHKPPVQDAAGAMAKAAGMAKAEGQSFKDFLSAAGDAFSS